MQLTDHTPAERSIMKLANVIHAVALRHPGLGRALRDRNSTATFSLDFERLAERLEHYYLVTQERGRMLEEAALQVREAERLERKLAHVQKRHAKVSAQVKRVMDAMPPALVPDALNWDEAVIATVANMKNLARCLEQEVQGYKQLQRFVFPNETVEALSADREALRRELQKERRLRQMAEDMLARSSSFSLPRELAETKRKLQEAEHELAQFAEAEAIRVCFPSQQARELEAAKRRIESLQAMAKTETERALKAESRVHDLETALRGVLER